MNLQITAKNNVEVSDAIQEHVEKRIGKLSRYLPTISGGKVEISHEDAKLPEQRFTVQVTLDSKGVLIRAQERAGDIRTAIDKVADALANRLGRYKGKLYDKGKGSSPTRQGATQETQELDLPKRVVKSKRFLVKPMAEDEAINQMELLGHDFFLFINAGSNKVNLLYRREDSNYGLIEPEVG